MRTLRDPTKHEPDRPSVTAKDINRVLNNILDMLELLQQTPLDYQAKICVKVNEDMVLELKDKLDNQ